MRTVIRQIWRDWSRAVCSARSYLKNGGIGRHVATFAVGAVIGTILSISPLFIVLMLGSPLLCVVIVRLSRLPIRRDALVALSAYFVLAICHYLPVKYLDVKVGPIVYENVTLTQLCERLREDYGVICLVPDVLNQGDRLSFCTRQRLSRRDVLRKLSAETGRPLHILYCGTGATILFGSHPSFTYLGEPDHGRHNGVHP